MITPEIVSYIRAQLQAGASREALVSSLSSRGWRLEDIQEGLNAASGSAPQGSVQTSAVPQHKMGTIGKVILWVLVCGIIILVIAAAGIGYFVYSNISAIPSKLCSGASNSDKASCEQNVKNFVGSLAKNAANDQNTGVNQSNDSGTSNGNPAASTASGSNNGSGCAGMSNESADWSSSLAGVSGINDPLLCYYSQSADMSGVTKVTMEMSGNSGQSGDTAKSVMDLTKNTMTIYDKNGRSTTIEVATSSAMLSQYSSGYSDWFKMQIPFIELCTKSTDWNTDGRWFSCDKVTVMGMTVSSNDPNTPKDVSEIRLSETDTGSGKELNIETRAVKGGTFSADAVVIDRQGRLTRSMKSVDIADYKSTDMMNSKIIEQIISGNPEASYSVVSVSYQR